MDSSGPKYKMDKDIQKNNSYFHIDALHGILYCEGDWTFKTFLSIEEQLKTSQMPTKISIINGKDIDHMDSTGVLLLQQIIKKRHQVELQEFSKQHQKLLKLVTLEKEKSPVTTTAPNTPKKQNILEKLGRATCDKLRDFFEYLDFIGEAAWLELRFFSKPKEFP